MTSIRFHECSHFMAICRHMGAKHSVKMPNGIMDVRNGLGTGIYKQLSRKMDFYARAFNRELRLNLNVRAENRTGKFFYSLNLYGANILPSGHAGEEDLFESMRSEFTLEAGDMAKAKSEVFGDRAEDVLNRMCIESVEILRMVKLFNEITTDIDMAEKYLL